MILYIGFVWHSYTKNTNKTFDFCKVLMVQQSGEVATFIEKHLVIMLVLFSHRCPIHKLLCRIKCYIITSSVKLHYVKRVNQGNRIKLQKNATDVPRRSAPPTCQQTTASCVPPCMSMWRIYGQPSAYMVIYPQRIKKG